MTFGAKFILTAAALAASAAVASAQEGVTVQSLISQDFVVVGAITSPVGPGLFLQKKDKVVFCLVVETPTSQDVTTRYCKPVK